MAKLYIVSTLSSGEVRAELDRQKVFTNKEKANLFFKECYQDLIKMVKGYEILENENRKDYFHIQIDDDQGTVYVGEMRETEVIE